MKRHARNSVFAALFVYALLWLLSSPTTLVDTTDTLTVRKIETVTLKPPASPAKSMSTKAEPQVIALSTVDVSESISIKLSKLDVTLPETLLPVLNDVSSQTLVGQYQALSSDDVAAEMLTFRLDELDEKPRLLRRISATLPKKLQRSGIQQARIILHVIIHENGNVEMVNIEKLAYPALKSLVPEVVRQARFTSPIRYGKPVKAEFLWPIIIKA